MICKWLPELILYENFEVWSEYESILYSVFCDDFKRTKPQFEGKDVSIRKHPIEYEKEEAFYHITCQDYLKDGERVPDLRRCERIKWVRKFIENYKCHFEECVECDGIKVWEEPYKGNQRVHILLEEERYMVVVERRPNYCLLITAFYFEHEHSLQKKLKKYYNIKQKALHNSETPLGTPSTTSR